MANTWSIDDVSVVIANLLQSATGQTYDGLDVSQLITVGQNTLDTNREGIMGALSQMITRTIFATREYNRKLKQLQMTPERFGNCIRKITLLDVADDVLPEVATQPEPPRTESGGSGSPIAVQTRGTHAQDNQWDDGNTFDQYEINKPRALELKFIGQQSYQILKTIFDTQLDTAFTSADEFQRFISSVFTYVNNKIEKIHEECARATLCNMIGGIWNSVDPIKGGVVHLITEYNADSGKTLTAATAFAPENIDDFTKWAFAKINNVSDLMTEYSANYHLNTADNTIMRHTPKVKQVAYFFAPYINQMKTRVLSGTYHDSFVQLPGYEGVNYWQDINNPEYLVSTSYTVTAASDGWAVANVTAKSNQATTPVFGIIADSDAMGYCPVNIRTHTSPYNANGEYRNIFWKFNERYFNDFTENAVIFLMD